MKPKTETNENDIVNGLNWANPEISCRSITPIIISPKTDIKKIRIEKHTRQGD